MGYITQDLLPSEQGATLAWENEKSWHFYNERFHRRCLIEIDIPHPRIRTGGTS